MKKLTLYKPLYPFTISQGFGQNLSDLYKKLGMLGHNGLDCVRGHLNGKYYEIDGAYVRASHEGVVTYTGIDSCEGLGVVVRTNEPFEYKGEETYFKTIYWHLKTGTIKVKTGDSVKIGDILAEAGNTGCSSGSHLHFGLKPIAKGENDWTWMNIEQNNGYFGAIDPLPYLNKLSAYEVMSSIQQMQSKIAKILAAIAELMKTFKK